MYLPAQFLPAADFCLQCLVNFPTVNVVSNSLKEWANDLHLFSVCVDRTNSKKKKKIGCEEDTGDNRLT